MRLPSAEHLSQLIHSPVDYLKLYMECEQDGTLPELLQALEALPFSEIREARRARILYRMGERHEGKALLESHLSEPLCLAWYVAEMVQEGGEEQLRRIITRYSVTWPINSRLTNLEAKSRLHLVRGIAFVTLNMVDAAAREFSEAIRLSELLGDHLTRNVAVMEFARRDLFDGQLDRARSTYRQVLQEVPAGTNIANYSMSYLMIVHWLLDLGDQGLAPWAQHALHAASLKNWTRPIPEYPTNVNIEGLGTALNLLQRIRVRRDRSLLYPPLDDFQKGLFPEVSELNQLQQTGSNNEVVQVMVQMAAALALSMTGDETALDLAREALQPPANGIPQLVLAQHAIFVESSILLRKMHEAQVPYTQLINTLERLPAASLKWLIWWMGEFTPHTMCLLAKQHRFLHEAAARCLRLMEHEAVFQEASLKTPAIQLNAVQQSQAPHQHNPILPFAVLQEHQQLLQRLGHPPVVLECLLQQWKEMPQVKETSKGKPLELTDGTSTMEP